MTSAEAIAGIAAETPEKRLLELLEGRVLSPAHRRVAQSILSDPTDAMFLSSVELARRAGVSQPSVTRFAVALGFQGYADMQKNLRALLGTFRPHESHFGSDGKLASAIDTERRNLEVLKATFDEDLIARVARDLMDCRGILSLGLRASAALALYFGYLVEKIRPNTRLETSGGSTAFDRMLHARRDDVEWIVCFALPRYPRELFELVEYGRQLGMRTLSITDQAVSPILRLSDEALIAPVANELVFDAQVAPMLVSTMLLEAMTDANPRLAQDRLDEVDEMAARTGAFASAL